jgi:hypothetical protein
MLHSFTNSPGRVTAAEPPRIQIERTYFLLSMMYINVAKYIYLTEHYSDMAKKETWIGTENGIDLFAIAEEQIDADREEAILAAIEDKRETVIDREIRRV